VRFGDDKRADIHEAFLSLGCALICWQSLRKTWRTAEADAILPGRPSTRSMFFRGNQVMRPAWGGSGWQPLDIGKHYAV
jgi:hypothetical protein